MPRSFLVKTHQSSKRLTYEGMKTHTDEAPCSVHAVSLIHTDILPHHHHHHLLTPSPWLQQEAWSLSSSSLSGSPPSPNTSPLSIFGRSMEAHSRSPVEACKTAESYTKINLEIQCVTGDHMSKEGPFPPSLPLLAVFPETSDQVSFDCLDCHRKCFNFSGLDKHQRLQLQCEWSSRKTFKCKYCEKEYVSLGALKMHIRTHTLPCVCKLCGKAFSRPWLLQGHIRTHTGATTGLCSLSSGNALKRWNQTGEKPFSCLHCSRAFADRSNLRAHLQTHSDVKKYQCASCFKTFSRISLLAKHQEAGCPCPDSLGGPLHTHVLSNC